MLGHVPCFLHAMNMTVLALRSQFPAAPAERWLYFCTTRWEQGANWGQVRVDTARRVCFILGPIQYAYLFLAQMGQAYLFFAFTQNLMSRFMAKRNVITVFETSVLFPKP